MIIDYKCDLNRDAIDKMFTPPPGGYRPISYEEVRQGYVRYFGNYRISGIKFILDTYPVKKARRIQIHLIRGGTTGLCPVFR